MDDCDAATTLRPGSVLASEKAKVLASRTLLLDCKRALLFLLDENARGSAGLFDKHDVDWKSKVSMRPLADFAIRNKKMKS